MKIHECAKEWRLKKKLTYEQLSELTGYSVIAIRKLEAGQRAPGEEHSEWVWQRYKMACAGAAAQLRSGKPFEW